VWSLLSHTNNLTCALRGVVPRPTRFFYSQAKLRKISAITTTTGREIIEKWVEVAGLVDLTSPITSHFLRHYFVTMVYEATGDLKLAQELARHESTETTERYTHLINPKLDEAYRLTFEDG